MSLNFKNKKILITGASKGIGRFIAVDLAKRGANVFALARDVEALEMLRTENPSITPIVCDVSGSQSSIDSALSQYHPFDGLVNNAGVAKLEKFLEVTKEALESQLSVNFIGATLIARSVAEGMINHSIKGSIVNISSQASQVPLAEHTGYCATKAAIDALTRNMALELGSHGIRVNSVNPTVVLTEMGRANWSDPAKAGGMFQRIPLKRFAEENDVCNSVLFLLSDMSSMTTGHALAVDGGAAAC